MKTSITLARAIAHLALICAIQPAEASTYKLKTQAKDASEPYLRNEGRNRAQWKNETNKRGRNR